MLTLLTYPLQVPNDPAAVLETGEFQVALLRKYLGGELTLPASDDLAIPAPEAEVPEPSTSPVEWWQDRFENDQGSQQGTPKRDALEIYGKVSPNARLILDKLILASRLSPDSKYEPCYGETLAAGLDLSMPQFRGTLASFKMRAIEMSRPNPVCFEPGPYGGRYSLHPDAAEPFVWAKERYELAKLLDERTTLAADAHDQFQEAHNETRAIERQLEALQGRDDLQAVMERAGLEVRLNQARERQTQLFEEHEKCDEAMTQLWPIEEAMDKEE